MLLILCMTIWISTLRLPFDPLHSILYWQKQKKMNHCNSNSSNNCIDAIKFGQYDEQTVVNVRSNWVIKLMHCLPTVPSTHFNCEMYVYETIFLLYYFLLVFFCHACLLISMTVFMIWIFLCFWKKNGIHFYLLPFNTKMKSRNEIHSVFGQKFKMKKNMTAFDIECVCVSVCMHACIVTRIDRKRIWAFNWEFFWSLFLLLAILLLFVYRDFSLVCAVFFFCELTNTIHICALAFRFYDIQMTR